MGLMSNDASSKRRTKKNPRCKTCGKVIRVPMGWSVGPAVRRHYWKQHRDNMQPPRKDKE